MISLISSQSRGRAQHGWLDSYHSFSFADYYNPEAMGFRHLRVINEDRIQGGGGFPPHPHRDMEIITYMVEGALEHQDSMGNQAVIRPGEIQHMSAGTGVVHSEFNPSPTELAHLLQIWILPDKTRYTPRYGQKDFSPQLKNNQLVLVASQEGREGSIPIHQDVNLYLAHWKGAVEEKLHLEQGRHVWVQLVKGELHINGEILRSGDAVAISDERELKLVASERAEFLLFDLN